MGGSRVVRVEAWANYFSFWRRSGHTASSRFRSCQGLPGLGFREPDEAIGQEQALSKMSIGDCQEPFFLSSGRWKTIRVLLRLAQRAAVLSRLCNKAAQLWLCG